MSEEKKQNMVDVLIESWAGHVEKTHEAHLVAYAINRAKTYGWQIPEGATGQENEPESMEKSVAASDAFDAMLRHALRKVFDAGVQVGRANLTPEAEKHLQEMLSSSTH